MKKLLLVLALILPLAACAGARTDFSIITASVQNPVTPKMMYDVENGLRFAVAGLVTYRRLCIAGAADANCREVIAKIQTYTIAAKPIIVSLRQALKTNDQINAIVAYNALHDILAGINNTRRIAGV